MHLCNYQIISLPPTSNPPRNPKTVLSFNTHVLYPKCILLHERNKMVTQNINFTKTKTKQQHRKQKQNATLIK